MKIALCKSHFAGPVSGADETIVAYAIALHEAGYDVRVLLLYPCADDDQYYLRLKNSGVPVFFVTRSLIFKMLRIIRHLLASSFFFILLVPRSKEFLRQIWQILMKPMTRPRYRACRDFLKFARPDILHVFTPETGATLMIRAGHELGIPVLYHEMGTTHHVRMLKNYYRRLKKVLPLCTQVAALSPSLAAEWSVRFPFLPSISVLPLIMERTNIFHLDSPGQDAGKEVVFGFAARLEEAKGPLLLLNALATINREQPSAIARLAGIGPQLLKAKLRARKLALNEACEFVGRYSEPLGRTAFMESLDVFVLPSFAEGTPNGMIEAMAHGVPVIATKVGGIPDVLDADSGILVPPGDAAALADAMLRLAQDPKRRKEMGEAAKKRYEALFTPKVVLPLILQTYGRVMRNGHDVRKEISENGNFHPWAHASEHCQELPK